MLLDTAILSILAVGMTLFWSLGHRPFFRVRLALTGMIAGMMIKDNPHLSPIFMLLFGLYWEVY